MKIGLKIAIGFSVGAAMIAALGIVGFRNAQVQTKNAWWETHTYQVVSNLDNALSALKDAETGQRGFIITGRDEYLEPYNAGVRAERQSFEALTALTRDNPTQQQHLEQVKPLIDAKLAELQETIKLRKEQGLQAALPIILTNRGKKIMDDIRSVFDQMERHERHLMEVRTQAADASAQRVKWTILFGAPLSFLVLGLIGFTLTRHIAPPLASVTRSALRISQGDLADPLKPTNRADEVGVLQQSFVQMTEWLRRMAGYAGQIAQQDLTVDVVPLSKRDELGNSFSSMVKNLRTMTEELQQRSEELAQQNEELSQQSEELAQQNEELIQQEEHSRHLASFPQRNPAPIVELGSSGDVTFLNPAMQRVLESLGMDSESVKALLPGDLGTILRDWDKSSEAVLYREVSVNDRVFDETIHLIPEFDVSRIYAVDITARKQAEEALREARDELEQRVLDRTEALRRQADLLERAYNAIIVRDLDRKIIFWNARAEQIYGFTRDEALGQKTDALLQAQFPVPFEEHMAVLTAEAHWEGELVHTTKDGRQITVLSRQALQKDEAGNPLAIMEINLDITERKQAEEEIKKYASQLELSNRELQDFAFVASHDLQEPLRKIQAFGDQLKTGYGECLDAEGLDYLARMQSAAFRMQALIQALLNYSRVTTKARPFSPTDLAAIAREVAGDLEIRIMETGGRMEIGDLPKIEADPTQMRQLILNLVGNALKFHGDEKPVVKVYGRSASNGPSQQGLYQIIVEDNGIGFDEKYLDRIFTPFQRLHGRGTYEGTGIGLAICRKIVDRHGGNITARSAPGKGTTFIVTLPVKQPKGGM